MSTISQYAFTNYFKADQLTKSQVTEMNIASYKIDAADTDGDGVLTFEEIISNTTLCNEIIKQMMSTDSTKVNKAAPEATDANVPEENSEASLSYQA